MGAESLQEVLQKTAAEYMAANPGAAMPGVNAVPPSPVGVPSWLTPPTPPQNALPVPIGWSISIEFPVQTPEGPGKASADLAFPVESWPQAQAVIQQLIYQGLPVKVFRPKQQWGQPGWQQNGPQRYGGYNRYGGPPPQFQGNQWGR